MGGASVSSSTSSTDELFNFVDESVKSNQSSCKVDESLTKIDDVNIFNMLNGDSYLNSKEFPDSGSRSDPIDSAKVRQTCKLLADVSRSYKDINTRIARFEEIKSMVLSYTPGSWVEKFDGADQAEYDIPKTTTLLLVGPKGSGKSSLVNKISQVLEDSVFSPARAQVTYNQSAEDGTYFVQQYTVPRESGTFCLYDTRGLSTDACESLDMLRPWMTKGVRHGELVKRESDSADLKAALDCKAMEKRYISREKAINHVVFVVNGLSVLESMMDDDTKQHEYIELMATIFNDQLLSFKDDKPVVVMTHGDLMSLSDRVSVRVYLGEKFGIPPTKQIFDIPDSNDLESSLAIVDMLIYCLEHADRNLPAKNKPEPAPRGKSDARDNNTPKDAKTSTENKPPPPSECESFVAVLIIAFLVFLYWCTFY